MGRGGTTPPPLDKAHHPWWFWGGAAGRMPFVRYGYFVTIKCRGGTTPPQGWYHPNLLLKYHSNTT